MPELILDSFQKEAISLARQGHSVIVSAPTGSGKTLIAERIIEEAISAGKGVIYTAPIKALSNQKFRDFSKKYPEHTGILTGDVSINRNAKILIMTTEIFRNAIMVNPQEFAERGWVIFDEIHYLDDIERGTVWEEAIILLPPSMRMLALSATLPNLDQFTQWLSKIHKHPVTAVVEKTRPVPLQFSFQCNNIIFPDFKSLKKANILEQERHKYNTYGRNHNQPEELWRANRLSTVINHLREHDSLPCIYFAFSRRRCEELAQETGHFDFLDSGEKTRIRELFTSLMDKFNVSSEHTSFLYDQITRGVAYHHAGLLPTLKEVIERLFTSGLIKLIFTTETFALGINMPARTVAFDELTKFYGFAHHQLRTRDFYQMAGRAGRRGIDTQGTIISRVNPRYMGMLALEKIIFGNYEPITSQFNSCYATVLNLYKLMGEKIYDLYPLSFHYHQTAEWQKKDALKLLHSRVDLLKHMGHIKDKKLTSKGELASAMYSFELIVSELFEKGFFEQLSSLDICITACALVYEPRKSDHKPALDKHVKNLMRSLLVHNRDIFRIERKFKILPASKKLYFHLSSPARLWYEGKNFSEIRKFCSADEGEIVRYFRMAIQVLRELHACAALSLEAKEKIRECLRRINRDEVDAEKQLRQEI